MNTNTNKTSNKMMTAAAIVMAAFTLAAGAGHTMAAKTSTAAPAAKVTSATPAAKHSSALDAAVVAPWTRVVGNDVAATATA